MDWSPDQFRFIITEHSKLTPHDIARIAEAAWFHPDSGPDLPPDRIQLEEFRRVVFPLCARWPASPETAIADAIEPLFRQHVEPLLKPDYSATIAYANQTLDISVAKPDNADIAAPNRETSNDILIDLEGRFQPSGSCHGDPEEECHAVVELRFDGLQRDWTLRARTRYTTDGTPMSERHLANINVQLAQAPFIILRNTDAKAILDRLGPDLQDLLRTIADGHTSEVEHPDHYGEPVGVLSARARDAYDRLLRLADTSSVLHDVPPTLSTSDILETEIPPCKPGENPYAAGIRIMKTVREQNPAARFWTSRAEIAARIHQMLADC